jgi:hypothetical protein
MRSPILPLLLLASAGLVSADSASGQSLPAAVRLSLESSGEDKFADRLSDRMEPRATPDRGDVEDLLKRWERATGGPADPLEWLTVARLWVRAGEAGRATEALERAEGRLPEGLLELELARIGWLAGDPSAGAHYWRFCEAADELGALEAWLDVEVLATPDEHAAWDRFRRLPAGQRDDCAFFREFWNERAARSGMGVDARVGLHYERLRYAMGHYVRRGRAQEVSASGKLNARLGREGSPRFDDRGLLYLRLGPPDETASIIGGDCYEPNVSWYYRFPEGDRLYHLSPLGGNDNWWLLGNLGEVFRCSLDGSGRVATDRNPMVAIAPLLTDIPPAVLRDIYVTRGQLDPRYARMAYRFDTSRMIETLQDERDLTWADGLYAVTTVPERPDVKMDVDFLHEWVQFRLPTPTRTRVWLLLAISGEDLADVKVDPDYGLEVVVTALGDDGSLAGPVGGRLQFPAEGADLVVRLPLDLPPGSWEARVLIRSGPGRRPGDDSREQPSGGYAVSPLPVRELVGALPQLSDIAVSPDSGGAWGQTPGIALSPSPVHATDGRLWIYFEAYNLTPGGRYAATVRLDPEGDGQPFDLEFSGLAASADRLGTRSALRLDLEGTPPGRYQLSLTVRDIASDRVTLPAKTSITLVGGG